MLPILIADILNTELRKLPEIHDKNYQVILCGDFNRDPRGSFIKDVLRNTDKKFYSKSIDIGTCCDPVSYGKHPDYTMNYDYIFNTIEEPTVYKTLPLGTLPKDGNGNKLISDHLPSFGKVPRGSVL